MTEALYFDGQVATFSYADDGQRETASTQTNAMAATPVTRYTYDASRRPKRVTSPDERAVPYTYANANHRPRITTWLDDTTQVLVNGLFYPIKPLTVHIVTCRTA